MYVKHDLYHQERYYSAKPMRRGCYKKVPNWVFDQIEIEKHLTWIADQCEQTAEEGAFLGRCREYKNARERRD